MPKPGSRYEFSHPDIPIDPNRLLAVIADGEAAEEARRGRHAAVMTALAEGRTPSASEAAGGGTLSRLLSEAEAAAASRDRFRTERRWSEAAEASFQAKRAERQEKIRAAQVAQAAEDARLLARIERARRCCRYARERGVIVPGMAAFVSEMEGVA